MKFGLSESTIKRIHSVLVRYPQVETTVVYGSRAKGHYKPGSNIDLTLYGGQDPTLRVLLPDTADEYQAMCRRCGRFVWMRGNTLLYSLLGYADCPGSATADNEP